MLQSDFQGSDVIKRLTKLLGGLPPDESEGTIRENRKVIDWLGTPQNIIPVLRQVLDVSSLLSDVARRSYRHINLFDKIVLVNGNHPASYRLTLHLWTPPYTARDLQQELIHEHRFNFWSVILTGTLQSENFVQCQNGAPYRQYRYVPELVRATTFHDFYEFSGEVGLERSMHQARQVGESYFLSAPTIHRIVLPRTDITCSLVLRGPRLRNYSYIYNTAYPKENAKFDNSMFSETMLADKLTHLLEALEKR